MRLNAADSNDLVAIPSLRNRSGDMIGGYSGVAAIPLKRCQATGDHLRIREHTAGLPNGPRVEINQSVAERPSTWIVWDEAVRAVPQIVERTNVVDEPQNLVRMMQVHSRRAKGDEPVARIARSIKRNAKI